MNNNCNVCNLDKESCNCENGNCVNCGGNKAICSNGVCKFSPENKKNMVDVFEQALRDPSRRTQKAQNARKHVEQYTWEKRAEQIIHFLTT